MKFAAACLLALVAAASARPQQLVDPQLIGTVGVARPAVAIVRKEIVHNADGGYSFVYETADPIFHEETGQLRPLTNENNEQVNVIVVTGRFSFTGEDGTTYTIEYVADENGFRPVGDHIPVAPTA